MPTLTQDEIDRAGQVFEEHSQFIEAVARRRVRADLVPDVVQDVGMAICIGLSRFRDEAKLTTWIFQIVACSAGRIARRERRQVELSGQFEQYAGPDADVSDGDTMDQAIDQGRRAAALHDAIEKLKPKHKAAIRNDLEDNEHISASRWTRLRARRKLRGLLDDDSRL